MVDDVSMLAGAIGDVDLRAFLARELQYGPLDVDRARAILRRGWLEARDALSLEAGPIAIANSQRMIERHRSSSGSSWAPGSSWVPWTEDARLFERAAAPE